MIGQKISTHLTNNCMLLSKTGHAGSFAYMVLGLKRLDKSSVQAKKKLTPKCFCLHPSLCLLVSNHFVLLQTIQTY